MFFFKHNLKKGLMTGHVKYMPSIEKHSCKYCKYRKKICSVPTCLTCRTLHDQSLSNQRGCDKMTCNKKFHFESLLWQFYSMKNFQNAGFSPLSTYAVRASIWSQGSQCHALTWKCNFFGKLSVFCFPLIDGQNVH